MDYHYEFDDVDFDNFRKSLVNSVNKAGLADIRHIDAKSISKPFDGRKLRIGFDHLGIEKKLYGDTIVIDGVVHLEGKNGDMIRKRISVVGFSLISLAGSKDDAIQKYIQKFARFLRENAG